MSDLVFRYCVKGAEPPEGWHYRDFGGHHGESRAEEGPGFGYFFREVKMDRNDLLDEAKKVTTMRQQNYGKPEQNLQNIADMWSAILGQKITPLTVSRMMIAVKIARMTGKEDHWDSWVDVAGYAAIAAELMDDKDV